MKRIAAFLVTLCLACAAFGQLALTGAGPSAVSGGGGGGGGGIARVGQTSGNGALSSATTTTSLPGGVSSGHFILLSVSTDTGTVTTPSGYTALTKLHASNPDGEDQYEFWKIAGSSESAPTYVADTAFANSWAITVYSGVDNTTPLDATPVGADTATSGSSPQNILNAGITTVTANTKLVWVASIDTTDAVAATITPPSGMTAFSNEFNTYSQIYVADADQAATGATGSKNGSMTFASGTAGSTTYLLALRPAP